MIDARGKHRERCRGKPVTVNPTMRRTAHPSTYYITQPIQEMKLIPLGSYSGKCSKDRPRRRTYSANLSPNTKDIRCDCEGALIGSIATKVRPGFRELTWYASNGGNQKRPKFMWNFIIRFSRKPCNLPSGTFADWFCNVICKQLLSYLQDFTGNATSSSKWHYSQILSRF